MSAQDTKEHIVDVAREVFARKTLANTTMNDLAKAADVSRRTIYLYFKNKEDVYYSVIERELMILGKRMEAVSHSSLSPEKKLIEVVITRLDSVKEVVQRNGNLRAYFFRDIWQVEKARRNYDKAEIELFKSILQEGVSRGDFRVDDTEIAAQLLHYCLKGIEVPYIRGNIGPDMDMRRRKRTIAAIIFGALHYDEDITRIQL